MKEKMILSISLLAVVIAVTSAIAFTAKADPGLMSMDAATVKAVLAVLGISLVLEVILTVTGLGFVLFEGLVTISEALAWRKPHTSR